MKIQAILESKPTKFKPNDYIIEAIEMMDKYRFEFFSKNLFADWEFIRNRKEDMYVDESGQRHCILAMNEESGDGILVDSNGYDYVRYGAFIANVKMAIEQQMAIIVDRIIDDATDSTSSGSWSVDQDELIEFYGISAKDDNGIADMLLSEIRRREEIAEINLTSDGLDMTLYLEYCRNFEGISLDQTMER